MYPSIAVAAALDQIADVRLAYVGSPDGMEGELVRRESDLPFWAIDTAAIKGRSPLALMRNVWRLLRGVGQAIQLLRTQRPAAIFGTGGYVCVPLFVAAWLLRIPRAIYLPDVVPGLAVRVLARIATVTLASIPDAAPYLHKTVATLDTWRGTRGEVVVTGYPVRGTIDPQRRHSTRARMGLDPDVPLLLVYGGSRGARSINTAVAMHLEALLGVVQILHICGRDGEEAQLRAQADALPGALRARYRLKAYLAADDDLTMPDALVAADMTVCRSGASVLGELPAAQVPAILVPLSYVHQDENADYLVQHGGAVKLDNETLDQTLVATVTALARDDQRRQLMQQGMQRCARPLAAQDMAKVLLRIAQGVSA